jgi:hypothetical protein
MQELVDKFIDQALVLSWWQWYKLNRVVPKPIRHIVIDLLQLSADSGLYYKNILIMM